ncbi:DEAD/DEAH box helicase [Microbulbifer agarilyticus]|uniref:DEAD/DEAH box helicase n=1 Tax=Microbulbifer agarilyticus TaxID=260552 RepID=UPI001C93FB38|nr:DEAD/DEAH box helicase [Microbulbifer agarilyticus]MBY6212364.1 DEAD/DEAH box helicase [Microbulbifer agarilyticus]
MPDHGWGALLPDDVSQWITFERANFGWHFDDANPISMAAKQAEGVAGLWNKLARYGLALLADEVGMGKTLQALSVMALLWKQNPDAKVLVMAPNRDICTHWSREYNSFLVDHYKQVDHLVRNLVDGGKIHEPVFCGRLSQLGQAVADGTGHFYLTTINSLSGLVPDKVVDQTAKLAYARTAAEDIHETLMQGLDGRGFDLVIIDEAHKFRNVRGGSQRVAAARALFGESGQRLAQKVLLLTATPSHSSLADVPAIFSYFTDIAQDEGTRTATDLLNTHAIRRLRMMEGAKDGTGRNTYHNKYSYRHERAIPADFRDNINAELFFALYQKRLVEDPDVKGNNRRFMYGFLEGFESAGATALPSPTNNKNDNEDTKGESFHQAPDSRVLKELTGEYYELFHSYPEHPKYGKLLDEIAPGAIFKRNVDISADKHLVFVRRIPSVREITQRANLAYDELFAKAIINAWAPKAQSQDAILEAWRRDGWSREYFNNFVNRQRRKYQGEDPSLGTDDPEDESSEDPGDEEKLSSRITDLFKVKKGTGDNTDCTNVRLRFRKPENLFSLFLEPASDYLDGKYTHFQRKSGNTRTPDRYAQAALAKRLELHDHLTQVTEAELNSGYLLEAFVQPLHTAWGMMYPLLQEEERQQLLDWKSRDAAILENLGNYLKAGFLYASPVIVELYCWFTQFSRELDGQKRQGKDVQSRYRQFMQFVRRKLPNSLMFKYFVAAIRTFDSLCEKNSDHALNGWQESWKDLTNLQNPAWYASGDSDNRQRLILGFNSPFYPNVLVATSVFQEGVNLHLQCNKVHHYGIAWTPGDNEQRVGRVDRLFGRVNEELRRNGDAELAIHYPYLKRSLDQEQVAAFIRHKHDVEDKIDQCRHYQIDRTIDLRNATGDWETFLRKPSPATETSDPYPARFTPEDLPSGRYRPLGYTGEQPLISHIGDHLKAITHACGHAFYQIESSSDLHSAQFLLEADVPARQRKQPVLAELRFSPELSALVTGTVYYLALTSPLATHTALMANNRSGMEIATRRFRALRSDYPLVKLTLEDSKDKSHFYFSARVDLPLFVLEGRHQMLSREEIASAYRQLYEVADLLEHKLFDDLQDLQKTDLDLELRADADTLGIADREELTRIRLRKGWRKERTPYGHVILAERFIAPSMVEQIKEHRFHGKPSTPERQILLALNNNVPLMQFYPLNGRIVAQSSFPAGDVQEEELQLLSRWFEHVAGLDVKTSVARAPEPVE